MLYHASVSGLDAANFPGKMAVVVSFYGCKFSCDFCNSKFKQFVSNTMSLGEIIGFVQDYIPLANGVILTGGEPTDQDITPLLASLKSLGLHVKLETHGYNTGVIGKLASKGFVDLLSIGLKAFQRYSPFRHMIKDLPPDYIDRVKRTLRLAKGVDKELVVLVIPGVSDSSETVSDASVLAKRYGARVVLEEFNPEGVFQGGSRPSYASLVELASHSLAETWIKTRREGYMFVHPEREVFF